MYDKKNVFRFSFDVIAVCFRLEFSVSGFRFSYICRLFLLRFHVFAFAFFFVVFFISIVWIISIYDET